MMVCKKRLSREARHIAVIFARLLVSLCDRDLEAKIILNTEEDSRPREGHIHGVSPFLFFSLIILGFPPLVLKS